MLKRKSSVLMIAIITLSGFMVLNFSWTAPAPSYTGDTYVYKILDDLGAPRPVGFLDTVTSEMVKRGEEMIFHGRTEKPGGGKSKYISLYYVCTNCHNTVIEDPVLSEMNPTTRLEYAKEHQLPFLQGTTFYGATNRETWYNDDYYKKYGDLVKPANHDVREAIQLCAQECSKGRVLENWEVDAILAYYYSISYKLSDIFSADEIEQLNNRMKNKSDYAGIISWIKSKYALKSPATFVEPPYNRDTQAVAKGDPQNGKAIYELSCLTCHKAYGCSDNVFDNSKFTFNKFSSDFSKNYWWLFEIVRHGQYGYAGHEPYMPHFTAERMTDQQVEDLKSYIDQQAAS